MWRAAVVPCLYAAAILAACVQTAPLEDRPCDCLPGYQCCSTTNTCVRSLQNCPALPVRDGAATEPTAAADMAGAADAAADLPVLPEAAAPDSSPETATPTDAPPDTGPLSGWTNIAPPPMLAGRSGHTAVWTGAEMIVWGGADNRIGQPDGARFDPATGRWSTMSTSTAVAACSGHSAVWTGTEMMVWGGRLAPSRPLCHQGGRYDPRTDRWTPIDDGGRLLGRTEHTALWTGEEMIIWGGLGEPDLTWVGARYHPQRGWSQVTTTDQPNPTYGHSAVWAGDRMIVWGGVSPLRHFSVITGGMYEPRLDRWTATDADAAPQPRSHHTAVWTGSAMLVWGGHGVTERIPGAVWGDGASFDPIANRWSAGLSVQGAGGRRVHHTAVWATGPSLAGGRMLIWGGAAESIGSSTPGLATGAAYDPVADRWTALPDNQAPLGRCFHTAVWTGSRMLIWGGLDPAATYGKYFADGAGYAP